MDIIGPIHLRLREARERSGLSIREAARRMRISDGTLRNWEAGETSPDVTDVQVICDVLMCPPSWLVFARKR